RSAGSTRRGRWRPPGTRAAGTGTTRPGAKRSRTALGERGKDVPTGPVEVDDVRLQRLLGVEDVAAPALQHGHRDHPGVPGAGEVAVAAGGRALALGAALAG